MSILNILIARRQLFSFVFSLLMLLWGGYGLYVNDLLKTTIDLASETAARQPVYLMFSAFISGAMVLTSYVIARVEVKNNDASQPTLAQVFGLTGWLLFGMTLALHFFIELGYVERV